MSPSANVVELWYQSELVGRVSRVVEDNGTYSGVIELAVTRIPETRGPSILEYVNFCVDWNERTRVEPHPPSVSEFDAFAAFVKSGLWFTKIGHSVQEIEDAPVFFKGHEVSWRVLPQDASRRVPRK